MEFLHVYEKPELLEDATGMYSDPVVVLVQMDVWSIHVYAIAKVGDQFLVEMFEARKEDKTSVPSDEELGDVLCNGANDYQMCPTLKTALSLILDGAAFHGGDALTALANKIEEETQCHMAS